MYSPWLDNEKRKEKMGNLWTGGNKLQALGVIQEHRKAEHLEMEETLGAAQCIHTHRLRK